VNRKQRRQAAKDRAAAGSTAPVTLAPVTAGDALSDMLGRFAGRGQPADAPIPNYVRDTVRDRVSKGLGGRRDRAALIRTVEAAMRFADTAWRAARDRTEAPGGKSLACKAGCSWCCYQQVSMSSYELPGLIAYIRESYQGERWERMLARLKERAAQIRALSVDDYRRLKVICPFDENGNCGVYPARPMKCRGYYSFDAQVCRWIVEDVEASIQARESNRLPEAFSGESVAIYDDAQFGMAEALQAGGFAYDHLNLVLAIELALERPELLDRWLAGDIDALAEARAR